MPMEGRFTLCNMAVEMGAAFATIQPDDITIDYIKGRRYAPAGAAWDAAVADWRTLKSDDDARFDQKITIDFTDIGPQVSWGISPQDVISINDVVPDPAAEPDSQKRRAMQAGLDHTGLVPVPQSRERRLTGCSLAPAPTTGFPICAPRQKLLRATRWPTM